MSHPPLKGCGLPASTMRLAGTWLSCARAPLSTLWPSLRTFASLQQPPPHLRKNQNHTTKPNIRSHKPNRARLKIYLNPARPEPTATRIMDGFYFVFRCGFSSKLFCFSTLTFIRSTPKACAKALTASSLASSFTFSCRVILRSRRGYPH